MRALALILMLLAPPALALDADEMFTDPALEQRAREIGRQLRCLKCRNQSIFDSNAGIAILSSAASGRGTDLRMGEGQHHTKSGRFAAFCPEHVGKDLLE